ncbi:MAG: histidine--tRNA ligase [Bacteroidota bacterium]
MAQVKARAITGFPEWLPQVKRIEQQWIDRIRAVYEHYGYLPIETPAIELLDVLRAKGDIDKEIYVVKKLHENASEKFGLHYDLTVPFARYVAQNQGQLTFPFRRYQMQKIWRGERPQKGRYREFYQCDIDVVDNGKLGLYFDFEVLYAGQEAMKALGIPEFVIGVSNRKIYEGFLEGIGVEDTENSLRIIDKMDKVGREGVAKLLREEVGLEAATIEQALLPAAIKSRDLSFVEEFRALGVHTEKTEAGISELASIMTMVAHAGDANVRADLSFVRGFDYYTGTIFEGKFVEDIGLGSICSGGRYDNLAARFTNRHLPGVGFSIGLSRIFGGMVDRGLLPDLNEPFIDVLVLRTDDNDLPEVVRLANVLRRRGYRVETYAYPDKIGKQFKYAGKRRVPYVWVASRDQAGQFEVKDMRSGEQALGDPETWKGEF